MANRSFLLAILMVAVSFPALSQVVPEIGHPGKGWPLSVGVAYSTFDTDWNETLSGGRISGGTIWADWNFYHLPPLWDGFGIEVEGRDLNYGRTGNDPKIRQDTVEGGVIYTTHFYRRFHPYAKFLVGDGSLDFKATDANFPNYSHDTRLIYSPSGGADTRLHESLWLRVNYEYQFWPDFFNHHTMNPRGWDIGLSYDFGGFR
ncbi:MAG TPA: outer membrane beta-barrel protein [Terriglobales bacterium]|jgi:opacity protein-like surface antigen|nr:outer membrane beta-barrel protein [Terriglobales bacterium]